MVREISAGGVVVRWRNGVWRLAVIELPRASSDSSDPPKGGWQKSLKPTLALPKGLVDPGERPLDSALREVREETGITADAIIKLGDIKYVYVRNWAGGERVFKIVSFYLMQYRSGVIDHIARAMRIEVARAKWIRLEDAPALLAYKGEKEMARKAMEYLTAHSNSENLPHATR